MTEDDTDSNFYTVPKGKIAKITTGDSNMSGKRFFEVATALASSINDFGDRPRRRYTMSHEERIAKDKKKAEKKRERQNRKKARK